MQKLHFIVIALLLSLPAFAGTPAKRHLEGTSQYVRCQKLLESLPKDQGFIRFYEYPDHIWIELMYGVQHIPRSGSFLQALVCSKYPFLPIDADLGFVNYRQLVEALIERPLDPDFSKVSIIRTTTDAFELYPQFMVSRHEIILNGVEIR